MLTQYLRRIYIRIMYRYYRNLLWLSPAHRGYIEWIRIICISLPIFILKNFKYFNKTNRKTNVRALHNKHYITYIPSSDEGFGGQICRYITVRLLARRYKLQYLYNPLVKNFHSQIDMDDYLGFGENETHYGDFINAHHDISILYLPHIDLRYNKGIQTRLLDCLFMKVPIYRDILFIISKYSFFPPYEENSYKYIKKILTKAYWERRKILPYSLPIINKTLKISVHIRRGEIESFKKNNDPQYFCRWLSMTWYETVLKELIGIFGYHNIHIDVFTDSDNEEEFTNLALLPNVSLYFKKDSKKQILHLFYTTIASDIVVCGLSGISFITGLISNAVMLVPSVKNKEVYFPENKNWMRVNADGLFNEETINRLKTIRAK
jgi:hypothetical protein